jgi:hypothetical protein
MAGIDAQLDIYQQEFLDILIKYDAQLLLYVIKPAAFEFIFHTQPQYYKSALVGLMYFYKFIRLYNRGDRGNPFYVLAIAAFALNFVDNACLNILSYGFLFSETEFVGLLYSIATYSISANSGTTVSTTALVAATCATDVIRLSLHDNIGNLVQYNEICKYIESYRTISIFMKLRAEIAQFIDTSMAWIMGFRAPGEHND